MTQTVAQSGLQAPELSSKPTCQRKQEGPTSLDQAVSFALSIPLCCSLPPPPGTSPCVLPPGCGLLVGRGWADPSLSHPQWVLSPRAKAPSQLLEECGFLPQKSRTLLYSHRCTGSRGVWGRNTLGKVRPIPPDTHGQVTLGCCSPGPLPILTTPTWERS